MRALAVVSSDAQISVYNPLSVFFFINRSPPALIEIGPYQIAFQSLRLFDVLGLLKSKFQSL